MAEKKEYAAKAEGFIHGEYRKKNGKLQLTDKEAKYLVMSGLVELVEEKTEEPKAEPDPATLERKTR